MKLNTQEVALNVLETIVGFNSRMSVLLKRMKALRRKLERDRVVTGMKLGVADEFRINRYS